jgi:hypothetical protein
MGKGRNKKGLQMEASLLRRLGSNQRPSGYEPDELPLLYFAMYLFEVWLRVFLPGPPAGELRYFLK